MTDLIVDEKYLRFPPPTFDCFMVKKGKLPSLRFYDEYTSMEYQEWFACHVLNCYKFMIRLFIVRDPAAISLFEEIINSDNFYNFIIKELITHTFLFRR